jgi:CYTH domain-containing protein
MASEIERKWVVTDVPRTDAWDPGVRLWQGYLARDGEVEVRIRAAGERRVLTVKGGRGMTRTEVELDIDGDAWDALWPLTEPRRIEKVRHRVAVEGGTAEVDVYEGGLAGLCTVEVEFASADEADAFRPPSWFGEEVTGDEAWSNAALAEHGRPFTQNPPNG